MITYAPTTRPLGDLIATEFDRAALSSQDPLEVSHLAVKSILRMLRGAQRVSVSVAPPGTYIIGKPGTLPLCMG